MRRCRRKNGGGTYHQHRSDPWSGQGAVCVNQPVLQPEGYSCDQRTCSKIKGLRSNRKLKGRLKHVLNQKYFVKNPTFGSAEEAITYMTKRLIEDGMAAEDFTEKVLDRENRRQRRSARLRFRIPLK